VRTLRPGFSPIEFCISSGWHSSHRHIAGKNSFMNRIAVVGWILVLGVRGSLDKPGDNVRKILSRKSWDQSSSWTWVSHFCLHSFSFPT
jgi:hypothetical protein